VPNTTNGKLDMQDITLHPAGERNSRRTTGRINAGGTSIEINAVNGNVQIRPRP
jgi:hypothetical protein